VLDPQGSGSDSNYSRLTGGETGGNLEGNLTLQKASGGTGGDVTASFTIGGSVLSSANLTIPVLKATLSIGGSLSGAVTVSDKIDGGRLSVGGNVGSGANITIADMVNSPEPLNFSSNFAGDLVLQTGIKEASGRSITFNNSAGAFAANGNIRVGPVSTTPPLGSVTFDGAIKIKDGSGSGGDLTGTIQVVGCHATSADLDICICGNNSGWVEIIQSGCTNQVDWSCVSGCP